MSTYTQILYQIVFATRNRVPCLTKDNRDQLFKYMSGIIENKKCILFQINGVEDHIHILTHLHPTVALADLVKDIKVSSSLFIKEEKLFPNFKSWQDGYGAFTYSTREADMLVNYIKNQEEHHKKVKAEDEYLSLLKRHEVKFNPDFLL